MSETPVEYNAANLATFLRGILGENDTNLAVLRSLLLRCGARETADDLAKACEPGGDVEAVVEKLKDPKSSHDACLAILRRFERFGDILAGLMPAGVWVRWSGKYNLLSYAEGSARLQEQRRKKQMREDKLAARLAKRDAPIPYKLAARRLRVPRGRIKVYIRDGYLVPVYKDGRKAAVGVTASSVETCKLYLQGWRYTEAGEPIAPGAYVSRDDACVALGRALSAVRRLALDGRLVRVFSRPTGSEEGCGFTLASVEEVRRELEAGVVFAQGGAKIVWAERVSCEEAAAVIGCSRSRVVDLANAGELERVYLDPNLKRTYGYTRASVVAYSQENPPKITARPAVPAPDFKVAVVPPAPRLRAATLAPADVMPAAIEPTTADVETPAAEIVERNPRTRTPRPVVVFRLHTTSEPERRSNMEITEDTNHATPSAENVGAADAAAHEESKKLQVAKAYTIHENGVIRAICVSEDDRDEITAALKFYRKTKGRESEIESALKLLESVRSTLGINAGATTEDTAAE